MKPWADFNGDLPDYDSPLRCVYESGVHYAVELLAKQLGVNDWTPVELAHTYRCGGPVTTDDILAALVKQAGDSIYAAELVFSQGARRCNFWSISANSSSGFKAIAYEIKTTRTDFKRDTAIEDLMHTRITPLPPHAIFMSNPGNPSQERRIARVDHIGPSPKNLPRPIFAPGTERKLGEVTGIWIDELSGSADDQ